MSLLPVLILAFMLGTGLHTTPTLKENPLWIFCLDFGPFFFLLLFPCSVIFPYLFIYLPLSHRHILESIFLILALQKSNAVNSFIPKYFFCFFIFIEKYFLFFIFIGKFMFTVSFSIFQKQRIEKKEKNEKKPVIQTS